MSAHKSYKPLSRRRGRVCTDVLGAVGGGGSLRLPVLSQESDEEERNGNISHTRINILLCFPWKSGSCGRMLDNVTGMRAASTSTDNRRKGRSECLATGGIGLFGQTGPNVQTGAALSTCSQLCSSTLLTLQKTVVGSKSNFLGRKFFSLQAVANV